MSWIAISDGSSALRAPRLAGLDDMRLLCSGTLAVEAAVVPDSEMPQTLVDFHREDGWKRSFRITLDIEGRVAVEHRQMRAVTRASLRIRKPERDTVLRVGYAWVGPGRRGLLSVHNLETGELEQAGFDAPQPWPLADLAALVDGAGHGFTGPGVSLLAVSDRVEALDEPLGMVAGSQIATPAGQRRVEDLRPGDRVHTADGGIAPVRLVLEREVPCAGRLAPVRLRAPFLGLTQDLMVSPEHRVLIGGPDAEYLFGADSVLVEARHLSQIADLRHVSQGPTVRYVQIVLDRHECISIAGAWAESLYLGGVTEPYRLRGGWSQANRLSARLPRHAPMATPLLKPYEAVVLVSAMCA